MNCFYYNVSLLTASFRFKSAAQLTLSHLFDSFDNSERSMNERKKVSQTQIDKVKLAARKIVLS